MWPTTEITKKLGIEYPIIQAPMAGGATTPELVAAVSNSGGLGSLGAGYMVADDIRKAIAKIRSLTNKPFAVNLFIPEKHHATLNQINEMCQLLENCCNELNIKIDPITSPYALSFEEQMSVVIEEKIPIFSFTFGIPGDSWISKLKSNKTVLIGTATNLDEAVLIEKSGIDFVVAQGSEAGGHRGTFVGEAEDSLISVLSLVPQLIDCVKIPVIAAGGIMDARGIVAALMLGADSVQMGTAFLSCAESGIHPEYKNTLLNVRQDNTTLTRVFSGKMARGIKNKFIEWMRPYQESILDYPIQNSLTRKMRKEAEKQNNIDFMSMWAGQSAYLSKGYPAAELIKKLIEDVNTLLEKLNEGHS